MKCIIYVVFLIGYLLSVSLSYADYLPIVSKTKNTIHISNRFNGTSLDIFGVLPQKKTKLDIFITGPRKKFTIYGKNIARKTVTLSGFYVGQHQKQNSSPSVAMIKNYLYKMGLYHHPPTVSVKGGVLFQSKIHIPDTAPVGHYTIDYNFVTEAGKMYHQKDSFILKHQGLQKTLYDIAFFYPVLNAILVIVTASLSSYILRFMFKKI